MTIQIIEGDCLAVLPTIPTASVDAIICDPPYPEINRAYGRLTEAAWWTLMMGVCTEARRILKPTGSAVFILQPNSRKVGSMRGWLWEFMAWVCRDWNCVQNVYWWNTTTMPQGSEARGLMRSSVKTCVWAGDPGCYRNQRAVLWQESERNAFMRMEARAKGTGATLEYSTSGSHYRRARVSDAAERRGGVTPFNLLPIPNANSTTSAGAYGHGAGTPLELAKWWTRYICPPGGVVCDPFAGSGTMGLAALAYGCSFVGIEKMPEYVAIMRARLAEAGAQPQLTEAT